MSYSPLSPDKGSRRNGILVATLGVEPQVVTITLDHLLSGGEAIVEVVVIYTETARVREALEVIGEEFRKASYPGIRLRAVPVSSADGPVGDFCTDEDLRALLRTLYGEIRRARQAGVVHLCISGGRKVMGILGMVVAQLLFGPEDRVWHLITEGWQPGSERRLHLSPEDKAWLVSVPVLRWSEAGVLMQTVAEMNDPAEVVAWYEKLSRANRIKRQREFIERWLTRAEREVVRLACRGLDNAAIAAALFKQEQTVANQLRGVYEKLRDWLGYPDGNVDRSKLIAEFAPYFALVEGSESK
ncbi:CRISPR-associated protein, Csx14 family [Desulfofundulus australicus DSM 11792]|jgi:CRISPR-associated protein Csx14|uniref:CRISPR-associated protein, Csx14 family n=1 Tax=Desulfofundulus australicus DSM 11792 TaxID=1121425 RepID=A0A1M5BD83_9FIRM|nr:MULTISPECIES: CRISPR-associated protein Csx14 [Desulfofundulus]MDK2888105.1 CRISPR-associated protein Csx14 [Thermoanaerobacter sp.]SHF40112.1 CRISPR-associated protein, Csx14 family [Desulfofundulus australicus DSM 11792]